MSTLDFTKKPATVAKPDHVGKVGATEIFESAVYEPVMVPVEGVYIDAFTGAETDQPTSYLLSEDGQTTLESKGNAQKMVQANYPGTTIPAERKGGGTGFGEIRDADGRVLERVTFDIKDLPLADQAKLIEVGVAIRTLIAEQRQIKARP